MGSSKVVWNGIKEIAKKMEAVQRDSAPKYLEKCGKLIVDRIRAVARLGKTMAYGDGEETLKPLTNQKYIDFRKSLANGRGKSKRITQKGQVGVGVDPSFFSPTKSNLTLTGQLLASIRVLKIEPSTFTVTIGAEGKRDAGPAGGGGVNNTDVLKGQAEQGRKIMGIDSKTKDRVRALAIEGIRQAIRKNLQK